MVFASFAAVTVGTITSALLRLLPALWMSADKALVPEQLYLLFCVPLLVFQAEHRISEARQQAAKSFLVFSGVILLFASIRELGGYGSIFGISVMPKLFSDMTLFRHSSSAAFMLAGVMIFVQGVVRRKGSGNLSFANPVNEHSSGDVPYLEKANEKTYLRVTFIFLGVTLLCGAYPQAMHFLFGGQKMLIYLLPATTLIQGVLIGLASLLSRSLHASFLTTRLKSIIIPAQAMILLLPFYFPIIEDKLPERLNLSMIFYYVYLIACCFFVCMTILFLRTVKRSLIFGRRPLFIEGLPLSFVLLGICLIIMSGVIAIVPSGMFEMTIP